jgi:hypothetical protein
MSREHRFPPWKLLAFAFALVSLGCADEPIGPPSPDPPLGSVPNNGWMSATANGEAFNSVFVTVTRHDNGLSFEGLTWVGDEDQLQIRIWVRTDVGLGMQDFGTAAGTGANVLWRPAYSLSQAWSAYGTNGSGTVNLTSLKADRATGTFSFTAQALSATTSPQTYSVTKGQFDIRF